MNFGYTVKAMEDFLQKSGGLRTGSLTLAMAQGPDAAKDAEKKAREMGKDLVRAIQEKRAYPQQTAEHKKWKDQFATSVKYNKENWKHNYDLWLSKGWLKA
jgi:hypothetical protein